MSSTPADEIFINALRTTFNKRPIIFGEDPARYDRLLALVATDVKPQTMREWLLVKDIVDAEWEFGRIRGFKASSLNGAVFAELRRRFRGSRERLTSKEAHTLNEQELRLANDEAGARESFNELLAESYLTMDEIATDAFQDEMARLLEIDKHADAARARRNRAYAELDSLRENSSARVNVPLLANSSSNGRLIDAGSANGPGTKTISQDDQPDPQAACAREAPPSQSSRAPADEERPKSKA